MDFAVPTPLSIISQKVWKIFYDELIPVKKDMQINLQQSALLHRLHGCCWRA